MREKINKRIIFIGILSMVLTGFLAISVFYNSFNMQVKSDIQNTGDIFGICYDKVDDYDDLEKFVREDLRITIISPEGEVVFESDTDKEEMENHGEREEVLEALESGQGEATRRSNTMGYNTYYYAKLMSDGNVLRTSMDVEAMYSYYYYAMPYLAVIFLIIVALSVITSRVVTKSIMKPIDDIAENLENLGETVPYKELEPFISALKKHQDKKDEITKLRQDFTANVSHELKTPLTSISGYAELIETGMAKNGDIINFATKIHLEAGRLITLIGDILNLSELDEQKYFSNLEKVDLYALIKLTRERLVFKADKRNITLQIMSEGNAFVLGNKMKLEEVVYNLCDNAIRYNKDGGVVRMRLWTKDNKVMLVVEDSGIGIKEEHIDRVFERFYRVDKSRSKETGGTGLGLAIVKHIVMNHGGKISVESVFGEGTRMTVVLNKLV